MEFQSPFSLSSYHNFALRFFTLEVTWYFRIAVITQLLQSWRIEISICLENKQREAKENSSLLEIHL